MRNFFDNLHWKWQNFMQDRYGYDRLSRHMVAVAFVLCVISFFISNLVVDILIWVLLVIAFLRTVSKKISKRRKEALAYDKLLGLPKKLIRNISRQKSDSGHKYFTCACGATLRVPRGRGRVEITCPRCGRKMIKKT